MSHKDVTRSFSKCREGDAGPGSIVPGLRRDLCLSRHETQLRDEPHTVWRLAKPAAPGLLGADGIGTALPTAGGCPRRGPSATASLQGGNVSSVQVIKTFSEVC